VRIDVLDLGSNTFHLLEAEVVGGSVLPVADRKLPVRIGEQAFTLGMIPDEAWHRGLAAIESLVAPLRWRKPVAVATGVFREARNGEAFLSAVRTRFGFDARLLTGEEEARLVYDGVRAEAMEPASRLAVFDLGGGSLECVVGEHGRIELAESVPLGVLRLRNAGADEIRARVHDIAGELLDAIRASEPDEIVLAAGTARALLKLSRRLGRRDAVLGCISRGSLRAMAELVRGCTPDELDDLGITASRHDTIASGALVLSTVVERLGVPLVRVATGALREGIVLHEAAQRARKVA
jgi:exopolyphosphatase/guanosine-5'-triphosphate,3'-diphosphate pyrophosphatase